MKKKWKEIKYWKKGAVVGLVFGLVIAFLSFLSVLLEFDFGAWPLKVGAFLFQKILPCQDGLCFFIIIPFGTIILVFGTTILGLLIGVVINKTKK